MLKYKTQSNLSLSSVNQISQWRTLCDLYVQFDLTENARYMHILIIIIKYASYTCYLKQGLIVISRKQVINCIWFFFSFEDCRNCIRGRKLHFPPAIFFKSYGYVSPNWRSNVFPNYFQVDSWHVGHFVLIIKNESTLLSS